MRPRQASPECISSLALWDMTISGALPGLPDTYLLVLGTAKAGQPAMRARDSTHLLHCNSSLDLRDMTIAVVRLRESCATSRLGHRQGVLLGR